jgi:peptidoglycan/xylan/chitin deacetylase (PgdA/CDA1 family)
MFDLLTTLTNRKIALPFYHAVAEQPLPHIKHLYRMKTVSEFQRDLDFLLRHFIPIDADTLYFHYIHKTTPEKPVFHLTFDDGLKELYEIVAPILLKKGVPATFFVNSGFTDNNALFYRYRESLCIEKLQPEDYLRNEKPYLTTDQIRMLSQQGFTIGAHSIDHPYFYKIPLVEQLRQTRESLNFVSSIVSQKLRLFAFPFTDFNVSKKFFEEIGPEVDLCFGTAGMKNDEISWNLQRIAGEREKYESLACILKKQYLKYIANLFCGRACIKR